jgi:hypothetical protein
VAARPLATGWAHLQPSQSAILTMPAGAQLHGLVVASSSGVRALHYASADEGLPGAAASLVLNRRTPGYWAGASLAAARLAVSVVENKDASVPELEVASKQALPEVASKQALPEVAIGIDPLAGQGGSRRSLVEEGGALPAEVRIAADRGADPGFDVVPGQAKPGRPPA